MGKRQGPQKNFGEWVLRRRWWILAGTLLVTAVSASGIRFLTFDNDSRIFFSRENPQLQALEALENTYNRIDNVLFILAPRNGDVFTRETLAAVEELTAACWKMPYSSRVDSLTNFQYARAERDNLIVADLVRDARQLSAADLERVRGTALSDPILLGKTVSPSGKVTGVNVTILTPGRSRQEVPEVAFFARKLAKDFRRRYPAIDCYLTGGVMFDFAFGEATQKDLVTLVPLMFLLLALVIGLTLGSLTGTLCTLLVILFSMLTALGLAAWAGISFNPASANAPTIILTLAIADSVHILATMSRQMSLGKSPRASIVESIRINLQPVFLTSATTAIGFLTMNLSDAPPFRDLGNIVAVGVTAAFAYSVLFLPSLVSLLSMKVKPGAAGFFNTGCDKLASFVIRRRRALLWGTWVLVAVLTPGILLIEFDDDFIQYLDRSYPVRVATDFMQDHLTGGDNIEYSLGSGESGGINNPAYLLKTDEFAAWYRGQPKVVHVSAVTDVIKSLNKNMHGDDQAFYRIPTLRELAAQYLLLYEISLPFGLDLNNQINIDKSATRLIVTLKDVTSKELRQMDRKARAWLRGNAPPAMFAYGSGMSIIWAHISERNIHTMLGAALWALVLISGLLIFSLRSLKLGLISLMPNLAPAFMAFGIWGIIERRVGLGLSVVVSLTIGIVVDDTVHFLSKYLRARRERGMNAFRAVRYAFNTVGMAMGITSLALVAGFAVLTFSGYKVNADMGTMSALTIILALALDFFFLPPLLMKADA